MSDKVEFVVRRHARWLVLSGLVGVFAGAAAALFLILLEWATNEREAYPAIMYGLPFAGAFIAWIYQRYGREIAGGQNLILDEIHDPKKIVPMHMAPFILLSTLLTHLFGGSAGREGTAVQMGASLADQLTHIFRLERADRKVLLVAGTGAGFGAAIGAPWAGVVFGMEVIQIGRLRPFAWFECFVASFVGYYTAIALRAPHSHFPIFAMQAFHFTDLFFVAVAGVVFGLVAKLFSYMTHQIGRMKIKGLTFPPLKAFFGGLLLIIFYYLEGSYRYDGLGIPIIQQALREPATFWDPLYKALFTALTIGTGFRGGEFIPLVFIGATLGSALSVILPVSFQLLAAVGFAAVFGAAANTPLACTVMAMEVFGYKIAPYAFVACYVSYYCSGHHGIYKAQRIYEPKHRKALWLLGWLGELPGRFFNGKAER